jgi:hypothetical protein
MIKMEKKNQFQEKKSKKKWVNLINLRPAIWDRDKKNYLKKKPEKEDQS